MRLRPLVLLAAAALAAPAPAAAQGPLQDALDSVDPRGRTTVTTDVAVTDVPRAVAAAGLQLGRPQTPAREPRVLDALGGLGELGTVDDRELSRASGFDPFAASRAVTVGLVTRVDGVDAAGLAAFLQGRGARPATLAGRPALLPGADEYGLAWPGGFVVPDGDRVGVAQVVGRDRDFTAALTPSRWSRTGSAAAAVACLSRAPLGAYVSAPRPLGRRGPARIAYDVGLAGGRPVARFCVVDRPAASARQARALHTGRFRLDARRILRGARVTRGGADGWRFARAALTLRGDRGPADLLGADALAPLLRR